MGTRVYERIYYIYLCVLCVSAVRYFHMKRVITCGTFDLFHYGHLRILERAKRLGDYLIVAVSTDEFNAVKRGKCVYP